MSIVELQQQENNGNSSSNSCVLPQLRGQAQRPVARADNDFLPQELMVALRQSALPSEYLGPSTTAHGHKSSRALPPGLSRRPDNAWHYARQREKYRFLLEQNPCTCGAGHDISFLCEAATPCLTHDQQNKPSAAQRPNDKSAVRALPIDPNESNIVLPESIVPQEFRLVKNVGVAPLEVYDDKNTTITEEHLRHVTVFPSLKPVSRAEVLKLKHTMNALLERITIEDSDLQGQTQLHNLLELIKEEQNIYNIVFHEIIRQVSVECKERGELLGKLRERYSSLLSRVPRQVKSLYEELIAQRALDRRLAEQLIQFKTTVGTLMLELEDVREHDRRVTEEAEIAQRDLKQALLESQKNASLLTEYHELYDLQRKRLEKQANVIAEERELWRDAAQTIALKVVMEHKLTTAKTLNLAEQAWYSLANHFAIYLMDKDTVDLTDVQKAANTWREIIETFDREQEQREYETSKNLNRLVHSIETLRNTFRQNHLDPDGKLLSIPDSKKTIEYLTQTRVWEELCTHEVEKFGGDTILVNEERMKKADRNLKRWIDMTERLLNRHPSSTTGESSEQEALKDLFDCIYLLHSQYRIRMTGENGLAQSIIFFVNVLETWNSKLNTYAHGSGKLNEAAWHAFYGQMEEWFDAINKTMTYIGKSMRFGETADSGKKKDEGKRIVDATSVLQQANKGLVSLRHYIESHNSRISDRALQLDAKMVHWLIQILIGLAPNQPTLSAEAREHLDANRIPTVNLIKIQKDLCEEITYMTGYIIKCCTSLTAEETINKRLEQRIGPELEVLDLKRMQDECNDWVYASKVILTELTGDESLVDIPPPIREVAKTSAKDEQISLDVTSKKPKEEEMKEVKTTDNNTISYEAINRGGLTERRQLERVFDNDTTAPSTTATASSKSAQVGFDALRTIAQLQQQLAESEARAAGLQEQTITLDVALREANQRIQQLESSQRPHQQ
ncbi:unnamed protein product [Adineta ricciae]|uniref:Axonemal dynein light chain domain-containing protein 1 n=1 Tax=Adineta ricciae TaxID=249248 RepID=A0A814AIU4_ADIRI|nr:unnamed protein product [Adineta ricciae]CAF1213930.1 unnamed protein product [Adineta ricciae]